MVEKNLRLVKSGRNRDDTPNSEDQSRPLGMTPAEAAEAARFKDFTLGRAAREVMLRQIWADLLEDVPPAA